jgi:DNA-binding LacI/PurR family transcriptional regulator
VPVELTDRIEDWRRRGETVTVRGHRLHAFWREGDAPCLLLLHGVPASSYDWRRLLEVEDQQAVLAFDFLGFGLSDKPADAPYAPTAHARRLAALVEHLALAHGHQRIAYVGPPELIQDGGRGVPYGVGRERLEAFRAALGRARLPLPPEYVRTTDGALSEAVAARATHALLDLPEPPTAVVAGVDTVAVAVLRALRERGCAVPGELALVSFDEPVYADLIDPSVTALERHDAELGRRAAEMLLAILEGRPRGGRAVERVTAPLRTRRSCGCDGTGALAT